MKQVESKGLAWALAALGAVLVFFGYWNFPVPELTPELNEEVASVVGLRPATGAFPGLWRQLVAFLPLTAHGLGLAGCVMAAGFCALMSLTLQSGLALLFRLSAPRGRPVRWLVPSLSLVVAVMASVSDPVWRAFSLLTPAGLALALGLLAVYFFVSGMADGCRFRFCLAGLVLGLLSAESPLALILGLSLVIAYFCLMRKLALSAALPEQMFVALGKFPVWRVTLLFLAGLFLGIAANLHYMVVRDDVGALGWNVSMALLHYAGDYVGLVPAAGSSIGYMLGIMLAVFPLVASVCLFLRLTDDDYGFPFGLGLVLLLMGVTAYFTQGPVRGLWFWTWLGDSGLVFSNLLLATFSICASAATAVIGATFAFDAFNKTRSKDRSRSVNACYAGAVVLTLVGISAGILPQLPHERLRDVLAFNGRVARETVRELNGARWVFTDGTCDAAIELEAWRRGTPTFAVNLMGGGTERDRRLIARGIANEGELEAALQGAPVLLRVWACEKENGLTNVALQIGFDLWRREHQLKRPIASAFVARTEGLREADVEGAQEIAERFAEEIVRLTPDVRAQDVPPLVRREFFRHSWRLSRFARYRNQALLAERLDLCNSVLRQMMQDIEKERVRVFMMMTPKEGLELALKRTDFAEATRYASTVLKINELDPRANFAMGMYFLLGNRFAEAEPYFKKVLETNPNEAAVLNNLSILYRKTRRYAEAREYADRALKILPDNEEVRKTYRAAHEKK